VFPTFEELSNVVGELNALFLSRGEHSILDVRQWRVVVENPAERGTSQCKTKSFTQQRNIHFFSDSLRDKLMEPFRGGLCGCKSGLGVGGAEEGDRECVMDSGDASLKQITEAIFGKPRSGGHRLYEWCVNRCKRGVKR